ncbi:DUF3021 family protein [Salinicoccus albus]|uniref:DUF3021 family protein n=1 Tax=Salinicoccus albus TaxID=418756 RepID=UPI00047850A3|nr:DUF3021 family protein [Salinicoccus albus]
MLWIQALIRGLIPLAIMGTLSVFLYFDDQIYTAGGTFITGMIITVVCAATVIYDVDRWGLRKQTLVHFLIMLVTVYPLLIISGWFSTSSVTDYLLIFLLFICTGVIIWSAVLGAIKIVTHKKKPRP